MVSVFNFTKRIIAARAKKIRFLTLFFLFLFQFGNCGELKIGKIKFIGNYFLSDKKLYSAIHSYAGGNYDQKTLNEDAKRISELYAREGYYNVSVSFPQIETKNPKAIDVSFIISENGKIRIDSLVIEGNKYISTKKLKKIFEKKPDLEQFSRNIRDLADFYVQNGFFFAEVRLDSLVKKKNRYYAFISVSENKHCEFEEFKFKGNQVTKEKTLLKISGLGKTRKFNMEILSRAEENIRKKQYIKDCRIIPLNPKELLIEIEEDRMTYFSGIIGYDNSQTKKNKFTGFVNMDFLNLFGSDRAISFSWKKFSADRSSIELKYHESGFYSVPFNGDLTFFREEVDSTYIKNTVDAEIYLYNLVHKYGVYLGVDDIYPGSRKTEIIKKSSYKKTGAFWIFNNSDYYLNPRKGTNFYLKYFYIFSRPEYKTVTKQALEISWKYYRELVNRLVFSLSLNAKGIENKNLTEFDFYYLGGSGSLRGFNEHQFSGYRIGWSNTELRFLFSRDSRVFLFSDYGYVKNLDYTFGALFGFGFGLRMQTKLGMLGIDYGIGYQNGKLRNPLDGIIHFGIETKI